jgi:hypothetical protein
MRPASCNLKREWIHDHVANQLVREGFAPRTICVRFCSVDSVGQLDDAYGGQRTFPIAIRRPYALDDLPYGVAAPFACNQDAGVQDEAQGVNPTPKYREACDYGRSLLYRRQSLGPCAARSPVPGREPPRALWIRTAGDHAAQRPRAAQPALKPSFSITISSPAREPGDPASHAALRLPECEPSPYPR